MKWVLGVALVAVIFASIPADAGIPNKTKVFDRWLLVYDQNPLTDQNRADIITVNGEGLALKLECEEHANLGFYLIFPVQEKEQDDNFQKNKEKEFTVNYRVDKGLVYDLVTNTMVAKSGDIGFANVDSTGVLKAILTDQLSGKARVVVAMDDDIHVFPGKGMAEATKAFVKICNINLKDEAE